MKEISIVVPIYNLENYLETFITDVLEQSFRGFELILINDGSTDRSYEICKKYEMLDKRIKVIDKKNEGAGKTRNLGIDLAIGKYIMFLDADDIIDKFLLEKMYVEIENKNCDLVMCNYSEFTKEGEKKSKIIDESFVLKGYKECRESYINLLKKNLIQSPWNKIYRLDIIKKHGIYFPDLRRAQDAVFNTSYFDYVQSYSYINDILYHYRINDIGASWKKFPKDYFDIAITLNDKYLEAINKWGENTQTNIKYLNTYFLGHVIGCIQYCFSPKWAFTKKDQLKYIKYIITHPKTLTCLQSYDDKGLFFSTTITLIKNKYVYMLYIVAGMRIMFKMLKCNSNSRSKITQIKKVN